MANSFASGLEVDREVSDAVCAPERGAGELHGARSDDRWRSNPRKRHAELAQLPRKDRYVVVESEIGADDVGARGLRSCWSRTTGRSMSASSLSKPSRRAKHWLTVEWLPKYAPELNDIEVVWHDLKAHHLAHQTFADADALDRAIHAAVAALNRERTVNPLVIQKSLP